MTAPKTNAVPPPNPRAGDRFALEMFGVERAFRYCPPGAFWMGSPETEEGRSEDETRREVALTQGFWIQETPTTQSLWEAATGSNPSYFKDDELPVEQVNWNDCQDFIERLRPFAPEGWRFALPTEAQWDYLPPLSCASSNCQYC